MILQKGPEGHKKKVMLRTDFEKEWCPISGGRLRLGYAVPESPNSLETLGKKVKGYA